jgi:hypothetical protein
MEKQRKKVLLAAVAMLSGIGAFAQGNGSAGINEATQMVTSYFDPATQLIYAIGAVVGLIGGVKVYNKFSSGKRTSKQAVMSASLERMQLFSTANKGNLFSSVVVFATFLIGHSI